MHMLDSSQQQLTEKFDTFLQCISFWVSANALLWLQQFFWKMFIQSFCHVSALRYTTKPQQKNQTTALYCERAWARPSSSSTGATETNMSRLWNEPGPPLWEASTLAKIYLFRPAFSKYWFKASTCLCYYLLLRELQFFSSGSSLILFWHVHGWF